MTQIFQKVSTRAWIYGASIFLLFLIFTYFFFSILAPFLLGWLIAYLFRPLVQWASLKGISSTISALGLTIILYVLFIMGAILLLPAVKNMILVISQYLVTYRESFWEWLHPWVQKTSQYVSPESSLQESVNTLFNNITQWGIQYLMGILQNSWELARVCIICLVTPLIGFHLMRDWDSIQNRLQLLIPLRYRASFFGGLEEVHQALSSYFRGQSAVCAVLALYYSCALSILGIQFGTVIGILTGILTFIPYFGLVFGFLSASFLSFFQYETASAIISISIIYIGGQMLEGGILTPWFIGKRIGIHPVIVLFTIFAGAMIKGITGILLALPVATILAALWRIARKHYLQSTFYLFSK